MISDELETLLRQWGRLLGERPPSEWGDEVPLGYLPQSTHPLERAKAFAPGRSGAIRQRTTMDRGGQARRAAMAQAAVAGTKLRMRVVPADFVDPVTCTETRSLRDPSRDWPVPESILRVDRAALDLLRIDRLRGLCLRAAYCTRGSHADKAGWVGERAERWVGINVFRNELAFAKVFVHARLTP